MNLLLRRKWPGNPQLSLRTFDTQAVTLINFILEPKGGGIFYLYEN